MIHLLALFIRLISLLLVGAACVAVIGLMVIMLINTPLYILLKALIPVVGIAVGIPLLIYTFAWAWDHKGGSSS